VASIKIRVGASLDANALSVFQPIERAGARVRDRLKKDFDAAAAAQAKAAAKGATAQEKEAARAAAAQEKASKKASDTAVREAKKAADAEVREAKRATDAQEREADRLAKYKLSVQIRSAAMASREMERQDRIAAREREKAERSFLGGPGGRIGIGRRAALGVSRGAAVLYGYGGAAAAAGARALGVDTDVAGMAQTGFANQELAQQVINASPSTTGMSVFGREQAAQGVEAQAQQVGNATATGTGDVLEGLRKYTALTGDLETGRAMLMDMAKLAKATGSSLEDMSSSSAEVANHLGDVPDKAGMTMAVMRAIAGQGKLGAVEIRDMARQMAKMASQAPKFEGDVSKTIAVLGAMAQESKLKGGSATASQAATSVMRFASAFSTPANVKHWARVGLSPFTDASRTKIRSPEEIVLEMLKKTNGDIPALGNLMPSGIGVRAVAGFASIYSEAGGGQKGLEAVDAEFKRLSHAAMTQEEVTRAFNAQMDTAKSKVQVFNNEMQQTVEQLDGALLPAFEALAPVILEMSKGFAEVMANILGLTKPKAERELQGSESGIINTIGNLGAWERDNLVSPGPEGTTAGDIAIQKSMAAAGPMLQKLNEQKAAAEAAVAKQDASLEKNRPSNYEGTPYTDDELKSLAKGGDTAAEQFTADKAQADRLHDTIKSLGRNIDTLTSALTSGRVIVRLPKGTPTPRTDGTTPGDSPVDEP
jgi:hypothetical protein